MTDTETVLISMVGNQKTKMPTDGATTAVDVAVSWRKAILSLCLWSLGDGMHEARIMGNPLTRLGQMLRSGFSCGHKESCWKRWAKLHNSIMSQKCILYSPLSIYPNLPLGSVGSVSTIYKTAWYIKTQRSYSLSHSLTSTLNCWSAPIDTCLTSASSNSCSKEVDRCLHADIHAVWATFPYTYRDKKKNKESSVTGRYYDDRYTGKYKTPKKWWNEPEDLQY